MYSSKKNPLLKINALIEKGRIEETLFSMDELELPLLASYQTFFPKHRALLNSDVFQEFWKSKREQLHIPQSSAFRFEKSSTLSEMDFVIGYLFYLLALESKEHNDLNKYKMFVNHAINFYSIHAWYLVIYELITSPISDLSTTCNTIAEALQAFDAQITLHGTPGYLLMSKAYLYLGLIATHEDEKYRQMSAFKLALKNLEWARLDEKRSSADIHNAYFGKGLGAGNTFGINNIDQMLQALRGLLTPMMTTIEQDSIIKEANSTYKKPDPSIALGDNSISEDQLTESVRKI